MSGARLVVFQRRAIREIEAADEWWRENRAAAPDLFVTELETAIAALALVPALGTLARSERVHDVRRVLLRKTRYHLYYRVREAIEILALWHTSRGIGPGL